MGLLDSLKSIWKGEDRALERGHFDAIAMQDSEAFFISYKGEISAIAPLFDALKNSYTPPMFDIDEAHASFYISQRDIYALEASDLGLLGLAPFFDGSIEIRLKGVIASGSASYELSYKGIDGERFTSYKGQVNGVVLKTPKGERLLKKEHYDLLNALDVLPKGLKDSPTQQEIDAYKYEHLAFIARVQELERAASESIGPLDVLRREVDKMRGTPLKDAPCQVAFSADEGECFDIDEQTNEALYSSEQLPLVELKGLPLDDSIRLARTISIDIRPQEDGSLKLLPNIDDLDESVIEDSPFIDDVRRDTLLLAAPLNKTLNPKGLNKNVPLDKSPTTKAPLILLDKEQVKTARFVKDKVIKEADVPYFMKNPSAFFATRYGSEIEAQGIEIKSLGFLYRVIGIGAVRIKGDFGSIPLDSPLASIIERDPSLLGQESLGQVLERFGKEHIGELKEIKEELVDAIENELDAMHIEEVKIPRSIFTHTIKKIDERIEVLTHEEEVAAAKKRGRYNIGMQILGNADTQEYYPEGHSSVPLSAIPIDDISLNPVFAHMTYPPKGSYQRSGVNWLCSLFDAGFRGALLADDMGLGKTYQAIAFLQRIKQGLGNPSASQAGDLAKSTFDSTNPSKQTPFRAIIVAPKALLANWEAEIELHLKAPLSVAQASLPSHKKALKALSRQFLDENKAAYTSQLAAMENNKGKEKLENRLGKFSSIKVDDEALLAIEKLKACEVIIITYESFKLNEFAFHMLNKKTPFSAIIFDEAQRIKEPTSGLSTSAKAIAANIPFTLLLTGTPIENSLRDIWCLIDTFDARLFGCFKDFKKDFVLDSSASDETRVDTSKRLRARIGNYMLRRMKSEEIDALPKKSILNHEVTLSMDEKASYDEMKNLPLPPMSKLAKLYLYNSHPELLEPMATFEDARLLYEYSKTKELLKILENIKAANEKVIVFTMRIATQDLLARTLGLYFNLPVEKVNGKNNKGNFLQKALARFKKREGFNIIVLSTLVAGVGLTITEANHIVHYERCYNPAKEDQATDRIYRIGQEKDVYIHQIIARLSDDVGVGNVHDALSNPWQSSEVSLDLAIDAILGSKRALSADSLIPMGSLSDSELLEAIGIGDTVGTSRG